MRKKLSQWILRMAGWRVNFAVSEVDKCVFCVAPHTSNWDFLLGKLAYTSLGRTAGFLIKKDWFFFPFNLIFRSMGGIPVDRGRSKDLTSQIVAMYKRSTHLALAVTPEGTRQKNAQWKRGFYYIALAAEVPIVLAYIDYKKKEVGSTQLFYPTGNYEEDLVKIKAYYQGVTARHPERFAL